MDQIEIIETGQGTVCISRHPATGVVLYELAGWGQSTADSRGVSLASYIHAIFGLVMQAKARRVLMIGGAGGTLASLLVRAGAQATIVDSDSLAFDLARRHFAMPASVICHTADGEAFLKAGGESYDAIVLDAFIGNVIPAHLLTPEFFTAMRARLTPGGSAFVNVHVKHDFDDYADMVAKAMKAAWPEVRVLDAMGQCPRNAIVMAGAVSRLRPPRLLTAPNVNAGVMKTELARMAFRPWKSSRWDFGR